MFLFFAFLGQKNDKSDFIFSFKNFLLKNEIKKKKGGGEKENDNNLLPKPSKIYTTYQKKQELKDQQGRGQERNDCVFHVSLLGGISGGKK